MSEGSTSPAPVQVPSKLSDIRRRVAESVTKPIPEEVRDAALKTSTINDFLSDKWLWVYFITFVAIGLILIFVYMIKKKADAYATVEKPTWVPNVYISGIILFIVYFLYMIGSYRAIRLTGRIKDKRLWIFHITYFVTLALQLVLGWLALYNQKFQWCFWLSFIAPIILAIQMFFGWFVDRVGFFMLLPALVLQILMIYVYYKFWKLNA